MVVGVCGRTKLERGRKPSLNKTLGGIQVIQPLYMCRINQKVSLSRFRDTTLTTTLLLLLSHFSHVQLCATPQTAAHQAPPSLGFSKQEHWSGLTFPSPRIQL